MRKTLHKWISTLVPVIPFILGVGIITLSFLPGKVVVPLIRPFPLADFGAHAFAYAVFAFFTLLAIRRGGVLRNFLIVFGSSLFLGLSIELLQPLFNRSFEGSDLLADLLGALVGYSVALLWLQKRKKQSDE